MLFSEAYPKKLCQNAQPIVEAFKKLKEGGQILAANGSWYRVIENDSEKIKQADYEFLLLDSSNNPFQYNLTFDGNEWKVFRKDLGAELGKMDDEAKELKKMEKRFIPETRILEMVEKKFSADNMMRKAPHIRLSMISFSISDGEFDVPAWRVEASNWPVISYLKSREKNKIVTMVVDALSGKMLDYKET